MDIIRNKLTKSFVLSIAIFFIACSGDRKFEKLEWSKNPNERYKMTSDLIKSNLIIGMNKKNVRALLTDDCKYCSDESNSWMYYTKMEKGAPDPIFEILDIEFKNDTVSLVSIRK